MKESIMRIRTTGMWGIFVFCLAAVAIAGTPPPPRTISYQGRLTDSGGSPVSDGSYNLNFAIWNDPSSNALSHKMWESGSVSVSTSSGLFSVNLGAPGQTVLPDSIFVQDTNLYVGMTVNGGAEMTPRTKLTSVAYAYEAGTVPDSSLYTTKIINEAGVVYTYGIGSKILDTALTDMSDIITIGIDVPTFGFVMVHASGEYSLSAATGDPNLMAFQIDQTAGGMQNDYDYQLVGFAQSPGNMNYLSSFSITKGFVVYFPGHYTFRLEAQNRYPAVNYFWSPTITATYFPTYYGLLAKSTDGVGSLDTAYVDGQVPVRVTHHVAQPIDALLKK